MSEQPPVSPYPPAVPQGQDAPQAHRPAWWYKLPLGLRIPLSILLLIGLMAVTGRLLTDSSSSGGSSGQCTTNACVTTDIQQSLTGVVAKDESVMTRVVCQQATVKANPGDSFTAKCTVTYSDGNVAQGYGTLLAAQRQVTFEPVSLSGS